MTRDQIKIRKFLHLPSFTPLDTIPFSVKLVTPSKDLLFLTSEKTIKLCNSCGGKRITNCLFIGGESPSIFSFKFGRAGDGGCYYEIRWVEFTTDNLDEIPYNYEFSQTDMDLFLKFLRDFK